MLNYDDLVGIPLPDEHGELRFVGAAGAVGDAEYVLLDEINRCRAGLHNFTNQPEQLANGVFNAVHQVFSHPGLWPSAQEVPTKLRRHVKTEPGTRHFACDPPGPAQLVPGRCRDPLVMRRSDALSRRHSLRGVDVPLDSEGIADQWMASPAPSRVEDRPTWTPGWRATERGTVSTTNDGRSGWIRWNEARIRIRDKYWAELLAEQRADLEARADERGTVRLAPMLWVDPDPEAFSAAGGGTNWKANAEEAEGYLCLGHDIIVVPTLDMAYEVIDRLAKRGYLLTDKPAPKHLKYQRTTDA